MYKTNIYTINTHIYSIINLSTKVMLHIKSYPLIHNEMCITKTTLWHIYYYYALNAIHNIYYKKLHIITNITI